MTFHAFARGAFPPLVLAAGLAFAAAPIPAAAQSAAHVATGQNGRVTAAQEVSATVTVQSVDLATRHVTVKRPSGETMTLQISDRVRNLDQLKPGDKINAIYYGEMELALASSDKPLPKDRQSVVASRSQPGELPGGVVANHIVVTGAVVGLDKANNRLKVVNPRGGEVHEINVTSPQGREMLQRLKVGDKITAQVTEGLLISVERG